MTDKLNGTNRVAAVLIATIALAFMLIFPAVSGDDGVDVTHETPSEGVPEGQEDEGLGGMLSDLTDRDEPEEEAGDGEVPWNELMLIIMFTGFLAAIMIGSVLSRRRRKQRERAWDEEPAEMGRKLKSANRPSPLPQAERSSAYHREQHVPAQPYRQPGTPQYHQPVAQPYRQYHQQGYQQQGAGGYRQQRAGGYQQQRAGGYQQQRVGGYQQQRSGGYQQQRGSGYQQPPADNRRRKVVKVARRAPNKGGIRDPATGKAPKIEWDD